MLNFNCNTRCLALKLFNFNWTLLISINDFWRQSFVLIFIFFHVMRLSVSNHVKLVLCVRINGRNYCQSYFAFVFPVTLTFISSKWYPVTCLYALQWIWYIMYLISCNKLDSKIFFKSWILDVLVYTSSAMTLYSSIL